MHDHTQTLTSHHLLKSPSLNAQILEKEVAQTRHSFPNGLVGSGGLHPHHLRHLTNYIALLPKERVTCSSSPSLPLCTNLPASVCPFFFGATFIAL